MPSLKGCVLRLRDVSQQFGGLTALSEVNFCMQPGEILGIMGPNGAGKTTLFNVITGFISPTKGRLFYRDHELTGLGAHQVVDLGIARTFQIPRPFRGMTVYENVLVAALCNRSRRTSTGSKKAEDVARQSLERVSLQQRMGADVSALPQGDLRRLEIARALATQPDILLLDEPFSGLSYREMEELARLVRMLNEERMSILIIEHKLKMLMNLAKRILVLNFGVSIAMGTPAEVIDNEAVIQAYLGRSEKGLAHS